jgi:tetratricopeptide (TPR) repeat protein
MPKNDNTKDAWNRVGYARLANSNFKDALFAFESALEIDPKNFDGLLGRSFSCHKLGKIDDAILAYEKWLEFISISSSDIKVRDNLQFLKNYVNYICYGINCKRLE